jgi:hypothetical protein
MARLSYNFWLAAVLLFTTNAASLSLGAWFAYSEGMQVGFDQGQKAGYANGLGVGIKEGLKAKAQQ